MSLQIGYIDSDGCARIRIRISGTFPEVFLDIDALIDTGFTGFLMLPVVHALPLGLVLIGTVESMLADGSKISSYLAQGTVTLGPALYLASIGATDFAISQMIDVFSRSMKDESVEGAITLDGDDVLIGMELLRSLKKSITIGPTLVTIYPANY